MTRPLFTTTAPLLAAFMLTIASCTGQNPASSLATNTSAKETAAPPTTHSQQVPFAHGQQIGTYIVELFEDSKGIVWIGTLSKGVARYDPLALNDGKEPLTFVTTDNGLAGNTVIDIVEDREGTLWFGTHTGLSKYSNGGFTNFTSKDGLIHDRVSQLMIDSKGTMWIGTWGGVSQFDGTHFTDFPLPTPEIEVPSYQETAEWITSILEDSKGNMWFSRSGYGVCTYDPTTSRFTELTKKDGLSSNCVQEIHEDKDGNFWFGSRIAEQDHPETDKRTGPGGLDRYNPLADAGNMFTHFPEIEGLTNNNVYMVSGDKSGNTWISAPGTGLYRYDGSSFTLFNTTDRMDITKSLAAQQLLDDSKGTLWIGFVGGLFRFDRASEQAGPPHFLNVSEAGPWEFQN